MFNQSNGEPVSPRVLTPGGGATASDNGWLSLLGANIENDQNCTAAQLKEIAINTGANIGDALGSVVDDPCRTCKIVAEAVADYEVCVTFIQELPSILCAAGKTLPASFCAGASWLDSWTKYYLGSLGANICNQKSALNKFINSFKVQADCMCDLYIPQCKAMNEPIPPTCQTNFPGAPTPPQ